MEKKAILSANRARIPAGQKQNIRSCGMNDENQVGDRNATRRQLKRNSEHLSTRGPPSKVYFGKYHQVLRSSTVPQEQNPTLRKRVYSTYNNSQISEDISSRPAIPGKLFKKDIDDDVEEMRKKFEQWDRDDYKENDVIADKKPSGPRIWHIEAYIEQNVFDDSAETTVQEIQP